MTEVVEEIPRALQPAVDAALAWLNQQRGSSFKVTGIVDPDQTLPRQNGEFELGLVLCQDDLCLREQLRVRQTDSGFEVALADAAAARDDPPALLDPPEGARKGWLAEQLAGHEFAVLVFYRGFW